MPRLVLVPVLVPVPVPVLVLVTVLVPVLVLVLVPVHCVPRFGSRRPRWPRFGPDGPAGERGCQRVPAPEHEDEDEHVHVHVHEHEDVHEHGHVLVDGRCGRARGRPRHLRGGHSPAMSQLPPAAALG